MNNVLSAVLGFTEEDLRENRNGMLSKSQKERIVKSANMVSMIIIITAVLLLIGFLILSKNPSMTAYIFAGFFTLTIIVLGLRFSLRAHKAADTGASEAVKGKVKYKYRGRYLYMFISDRSFPVLAAVKDVIPEGKSFIIYYSKNNTILSAEKA